MSGAKKFISNGAGLGTAIKGVYKGVGGILGLNPKGGGGGPGSNAFDIAAQAKKAEDRTEAQLTGALNEQKTVDAARTGVVNQLGQIAQGNGPSLATAQLKAAQDRNLAQLMAQQATNRVNGGGAGARNMAVAATTGNRQVAQDSAAAKLQEVNQARQQLFQEKQYADESARGRVDRAYDYSVAPKDKLQQYQMFREDLDQKRSAARQAAQAQMFGAIAGGAGAAIASDKQVKKDIKPESDKMQKFLEAMNAKSFEYKEPESEGQSEGNKFGVLAQDLEKSEVGQTLVKDTPNGKMVDVNSAVMAALAAQSDLNKRLKAVEKKKKA